MPSEARINFADTANAELGGLGPEFMWTGTTVIRDIQRDGDKLIYTTRPAPFAADGKMSVLTLVWQKTG